MNFKELSILFLMFILFTSCFSQNIPKLKYPNLHNTNWIIDYPENVNDPINSNEKKLIIEAFGENYKFKKQQLVSIKHFIRNRVSIVEYNLKDLEMIPLLSSVQLINDKISRPIFNIKTFNPLIYLFNNVDNKKTYRYRVDNSNYVINVKNRFNR
tara:strand:+ start:80 stop:544 length:465 start_codon:yes stop_codon:yes gene_type:complete